MGMVSLGRRSNSPSHKRLASAPQPTEQSPMLKSKFSFDKKLLPIFSGVKSESQDTINRPPTEIKYKWRQQQIISQQQQASSIDSSWRLRHFTCLWGGWLYKRSSGIVPRWQRRWFELWLESDSTGTELLRPLPDAAAAAQAARGPRAHRAVLRYTVPGRDGEDDARYLGLIAARRDHRHDRAGRACVSIELDGPRRPGPADGPSRPMLLDAVSNRRAAELLSRVAFLLASRPAD
jgi:hypothetical protein